MKTLSLLGLAVAGALALAAINPVAGSLSDEPSASAPPVLLRLMGLAERPDGTSVSSVSAMTELSTREFRELVLGADEQSCAIRTDPTPSQSTDVRVVEWTVSARLVAATADSATVDIRVARHRSAAGPASDDVEESRQVILRDDRPYPLDILRIRGGRCDRVTIELGFDLVDAAEVADAQLRYDLWLVHRAVGHGDSTDHLQASGRQGEQATYIFAPIHHASDGSPTPRSVSNGLETEVSGTLRGRVRADGSIALSVQTWRSVAEERRSGGLGNGGIKELVVRPGETIEVALPPVTGQLGERDAASLFHGQSTSIRITTTRLR